jgi:hypothetical protein
MSSRVLFAFGGFLVCFWVVSESREPRASAEQKDRDCDTIITALCPCEQKDTLCCPRGQYGPLLFSCQPKTGAICTDTTAKGDPLQVPCPGWYHVGTCAVPAISCFRGEPTFVACPQFSAGTCAP